MKSKGGPRNQAAPASAPASAPAVNPPTSPTGGKGGAKYRNRDGSKYITLPDSTSAPSSAQPSPTIPGIATAQSQTAASPVATEDGSVQVNKKKKKRREKAAAKLAAAASLNGTSNHASSAGHDPSQYAEDSEDDEGLDNREHQYPHAMTNGHALEHEGKSKKSKKKKKKGGPRSVDDTARTVAFTTQPTQGSGISRERIWNTSNQEERERIKEFWLGLGEDERKSLVKVEKDAVLQKMKEQQTQICSCSVCGRKRNAIEEELEGLYDAYYEELEQFANYSPDGQPGTLNSSRPFGYPHNRLGSYPGHQPSRGRIVEHVGDDDEEELGEPYSDDELDEDEVYSDEEPDPAHQPRTYATDFFNFGSSLTVQGGILTVADDLLQNDGKKFIEMMEQLAERRMAREGDANHDPYPRSYGHGGVNGSLPPVGHDHPPPPPPMLDEEYDDEEDEDYDESQEDPEDYDEDDDEIMTDEQRMEEGRRMFQIFAARMFEQRVLNAYREKVAKERQLKLVEEEEEEERRKEALKEKKAREAQKKKEKAAQKKAAAAEEKARKDAEKAAEEEARRQADAEKAEEARRKAEEKRKKKEAQRKAEEEERARKEAERQRQKQLHLEQERKVREAKEREKKAREEKLLQEKEAREQKDREALELKQKQEAEKRQKLAKPENKPSQKQTPSEEPSSKKATAPTATPLPMRPAPPTSNPALPVLPQQPPATSFASPKPAVATPALPKAPTPIRPRHASQQESLPSMLTTASASASASENPSLSQSPPLGHTPVPSSPGYSAPASHRGSTASHHSANMSQNLSPLQPGATRFPPVTQPSQLNTPFGGMNYPPVMHHVAPPGFGNTMFPPGPPAFRPPPQGMAPPGLSSPMLSRGFPAAGGPPGFPQAVPEPIGPFSSRGSYDATPSSHSRQPSGGFDSPMVHAAQPIVRPTPIGRPASVVHGQRAPMAIPPATAPKYGDDIENHLGSSALLDDSDDVATLPEFGSAPRRGYAAPGRQPGFPSVAFGDPGMLQQSQPQWGTSPIQHSVMNSFVGSPAPPPGFPGPAGWSVASPVPGFSTPINRPMPSRQPIHVVVRQKLCSICRDLAIQGQSSDGFVPLSRVLDAIKPHVDQNPLGNGPLTEHNLLELCETEGTMVNGGGNFDIVENANGRSIRWNEHKVLQSAGAFGAPGQFGSPNSSFGR